MLYKFERKWPFAKEQPCAMAGENCSYWHCQRLRPPLQRSPFWIPDLPVASSLFQFPSPNARLHAPSTKATGDESGNGKHVFSVQ